MATFGYTYTTLKTAIVNWTEDDSTEFANVVDDIIGLAELRIYKDVDLDITRKSATTTLTIGDRYLAKPTDFVIDRFLFTEASNLRSYLDRKDVSWINEYWPSTLTTGAGIGTPRYYSSWDDNTLVIAPTPDATLTVTMGYVRRPARLDGTQTTTWLTDNAPDVMLFACLSESAAFLQDLPRGQEPGMLDIWEGKYQLALIRLRDEEMRRQRRIESRYGESHSEI